jgi:hypothetical protein
MKNYFSLIVLSLSILLLISCEDSEKKMNEKFILEIESNLKDEFFKRNIDIDIIELKVEQVETFYLNESDSLVTILIKGALLNKALELSGSKNLSEFYTLDNIKNYMDMASNDLEFNYKKDKLNDSRFKNVFLVSFKIKYTAIFSDGSRDNKLYENSKFLFNEKFELISD